MKVYVTMRTTDILPPILPNSVWHVISRLIWDSDLIASRGILSLAEFIWAIILFIPGNTFPNNEIPHLAILSEHMWGLIFLCSGCIQIYIILYEHMGTNFAKIFAAFNAFLWIYLVLTIIIDSYPPVVGVAGELALMITAIWIWLRPYILAEGLYRVGFR